MIKYKTKVIVVVVCVIAFLGMLWGMIADPLAIVTVADKVLLVLVIPIYLCALAIPIIIAWSILKFPTLTKENEKLLAKWLKNNGYSPCNEPVKNIQIKSIDYNLGKNGYFNAGKNLGKYISNEYVIVSGECEFKFVPDVKNSIPLLENYSISYLGDKYLIMFFKHDQGRIRVYKKN